MKTTATLLGTGTSFGVPVIGCECPVCTSDRPENKRLRTSALIERDGFNLLIDCSPDFRRQALRHKIKRLDSLILTHHHADHVNGLDDLRAYWWIQQSPIEVYGEPYVLDDLRERFNYCFREQIMAGASPVLNLNPLTSDAPIDIGPFHIIPIRARHWKLDLFGYRIDDFAYMTDCSEIPPSSIEKLRGLNHLVINALRPKPHAAHFSLDQAHDVSREIGAANVYYTHISHKLEHFEAQAQLPPGHKIATDGLKIEW